MFRMDQDGTTIHATRGDAVTIKVSATDAEGNGYTFVEGDIVRFKVFKRKNCEEVKLQVDTRVEEETTEVTVILSKEDMKIDEYINKPVKYWYEIELNPDTTPITILGYDNDGEKVFILYPEGSVME